ncbi:MAG: DNA modification methylase [bacterium]
MSPEESAPMSAPMSVELRPLDAVRPYANNPRQNDDAVEAVAESIRRFGFRQPIVVDADGVIVAGHTRFRAAERLGLTTVPVHVATDLTADEIRASRLADNKTAELATWDTSMLSIELDALRGTGIDWTLLGFDEEELAKLLAPAGTEGLTDPDAVPEKPADPITKAGDLWLLGKHRLLCGDSTSATDVARLLDGAMPALMVTDPPYGVEYDPEWRMDAGLTGNTARMGKVMNDDRADWTEAWKLFPGDVAYVYHAGVFASTVQQSLERAGFAIRAQIIWAKDRLALSRGDYHWQHEPCWYAVREGGKGHRTDDRTQTTLWSIPARDDAGHGHGTQKPVECMERPVRNHLADTVYEPFAGSGTTLIACERTGRACIAMELDPGYCDVVVRRWEEFTGRKAERVQEEASA